MWPNWLEKQSSTIMKQVHVSAKRDYLETLAATKQPLTAVSELIWNGLDADALNVSVSLDRNGIDGIEKIVVEDNGNGIPHDEAELAFGNLGGSWKIPKRKTEVFKRSLHGKSGKGRFRAFALGNRIEWQTRYKSNGNISEYRILGRAADLEVFNIGDPTPANSSGTGTIVTITDIDKSLSALLQPSANDQLAEEFAIYLSEYPNIQIIYQNRRIDPAAAINRTDEFNLDDVEVDPGKAKIAASISIIEWKHATSRALYLCDETGVSLGHTTPGIHAHGYNFTAYLKSNYIRELDKEGLLTFEDLHPGLEALLLLAKKAMRDYFRKRMSEEATLLIKEWKDQHIYPYEGEATDPVEAVERQVFDVCAVNINEYLENFDEGNADNKKFTFSLVKEALKENPESLKSIIQGLLKLPKERQDDLAEILKRTTLSAVIEAAKTVADRLDFLKGLEHLVFGSESKEDLKERKLLHRIIANETWIFGEEFNLSADDESLTTVLTKHLHLLGRKVEKQDEVKREGGKRGIVDLMLSRRIPQPRVTELEHLVIELKAPKVPIDSRVLNQIESYAFAVANDERFRDVKARWIFWAVSNKVTDDARRKAHQSERPAWMLHDDAEQRITIWIKPWNQIIEDCRSRLNFYQEKLRYAADLDSAKAYLQKTHEKYLPDVFKKPEKAS